MAALTNKGLFYTEELGSMIRVAQVLGLTSTAFLAGKVFASSFTAVPAMLHAPAPLLAKQFKTVFDSDIYVNSIASVVGTGVFSFFAYRGTVHLCTSQKPMGIGLMLMRDPLQSPIPAPATKFSTPRPPPSSPQRSLTHSSSFTPSRGNSCKERTTSPTLLSRTLQPRAA